MIRSGLAVFALVAFAPAVAAQTPAVDTARSAGILGERFDGFMGFAGTPSPAVRSEVAKLNIARRALYHRFATSRGVSPEEVGITAGCQLLARVAVGQAYMLADGTWHRRAATQPAPVPDYCR
jgi:uncharacterized protein YdbL (DUF1318 family)